MKFKEFKDPTLITDYLVYEDGKVFRKDNNVEINPSNDKRRPTEPPIIYFRKKDNKRIFMYYDDFMAMMFIPTYIKGHKIIHKDGNNKNCKLDNLYINDAIITLKEIYNEKLRWIKVDVGQKLYYDYYICEDGRLYNATTDSFIKPFESHRKKDEGYLRYNLYIGKKVTDIIHVSVGRLVAYSFLTPIENKDIVIYKDNNRNNVDVNNLYFGDSWDLMTKNINNLPDREFTSIDSIIGKEKWKSLNDAIKKYGYEEELRDEYLISNYGRVYNKTKGHYVRQSNDNKCNRLGQCYKVISIHLKNKRNNSFNISFFIHRLVAMAFIKNPSLKPCINHINGNPECNIEYNLEWCTHEENNLHAINTNLIHTRMFEKYVDEDNWVMNTILAIIFAIYTDKLDEAFKIYNEYYVYYGDNLLKYEYNEFINLCDRIRSSSDYKKLYEFFKQNYNKICI